MEESSHYLAQQHSLRVNRHLLDSLPEAKSPFIEVILVLVLVHCYVN